MAYCVVPEGLPSEPGVGWGGGSALAGTSRLPARGGVSRPVELVAAFLL